MAKNLLDDMKELLKAVKNDPQALESLSKGIAYNPSQPAPAAPGISKQAPAPSRSEMCRKAVQEQWQPRFMKANPDQAADAKLGENVEGLVEDHFKENKTAEAQEGHSLAAKKSDTDVQPPIDAMAKTGAPAPATANLPKPSTQKPAPKKKPEPMYHGEKDMNKADIHDISSGKMIASHAQANVGDKRVATEHRRAEWWLGGRRTSDPQHRTESRLSPHQVRHHGKNLAAGHSQRATDRLFQNRASVKAKAKQIAADNKINSAKKDEYAGQTAGPMYMNETHKCVMEKWEPRYMKKDAPQPTASPTPNLNVGSTASSGADAASQIMAGFNSVKAEAGANPKGISSTHIIKPSDTAPVGAAGIKVNKPAGVKMAPIKGK